MIGLNNSSYSKSIDKAKDLILKKFYNILDISHFKLNNLTTNDQQKNISDKIDPTLTIKIERLDIPEKIFNYDNITDNNKRYFLISPNESN